MKYINLENKIKNYTIGLNANASYNKPFFIRSPMLFEGQFYPSKNSFNHFAEWPEHVEKIKEITDINKRNALLQRINENNIHFVGMSFSISELRALRTVQKILTIYDYKSNSPEKNKELTGNNAFNFTGTIPTLTITPADYLAIYDVNKTKTTTNKNHFNANEREIALKSLTTISQKMFYFLFTRKSIGSVTLTGESTTTANLIQTVAPVFKIHEIYTNTPTEKMIRNKLKSIIIEPSPLMLLDVDSYFMFIPPYEKDIRLATKGKRIAREVYNFVHYLLYQGEIKRGKKYFNWSTITIHLSTLIYKLRLEKYFSHSLRNPKRAYTIIEQCIEIAHLSGYLVSHTQENRNPDIVYTFILNKKKFYNG